MSTSAAAASFLSLYRCPCSFYSLDSTSPPALIFLASKSTEAPVPVAIRSSILTLLPPQYLHILTLTAAAVSGACSFTSSVSACAWRSNSSSWWHPLFAVLFWLCSWNLPNPGPFQSGQLPFLRLITVDYQVLEPGIGIFDGLFCSWFKAGSCA